MKDAQNEISSGAAKPQEHGGLPPVREPRTTRLALLGLFVLVGAGAIIFDGVRVRATTEQDLARWTREQAVPTVAVIEPQMGAPKQDLILPGDVQAYATAPIYARASGYVTGWHKDIGEKVSKGEALAEIDTPDLDQQYAQAKANLANATANATLAAATAKRYKTLVTQNIVSQQTDEEKTNDATSKAALVESAQADLARLEALVAFKKLVAPFDGIVTARNIDVGALINAGGTTGNALFQIADIRRMRVYVRVPQAFVADFRNGLKATLTMPQYPGQNFEATLVGSSNSITQESRTALVQFQADNPEGKLWPGTYTEVHFHLDARQDTLHVPATALMFGEHGIRVATVDANDAVQFKPVQLGRDIGTDIEIVSGLSPSDRLIDSPLETLVNGDKVRIVSGSKEPKPDARPKVVQATGTKTQE